MSVRKAVFPAAGLGTRFLPATKASPKEMLPLVDKPLIQYAVEEAQASGIEEFIIITGKHKRAIEDHFDSFHELEEVLQQKGKEALLQELNRLNNLSFAFIRQRAPLGLGHAVLCARPFVKDEAFAVLLSDDVIPPGESLLKDMIALHRQRGVAVVALQEVPQEEVHKYGVIRGSQVAPGLYRIEDLVEKPQEQEAPSRLAVIGRYILLPRVFEVLKDLPPGAAGEIQLTDALRVLAAEGALYGLLYRGRRYDAGDKFGFLMATVEMALESPELGERFRAFLQQVALKR